jgi:glycosyltransferase involved in cell wall biosynthesis
VVIGLISHQFPPHLGGMDRHAWGLAHALHAHEPVVVHTRRGGAPVPAGTPFEVRRTLAGHVGRDRAVLADRRIDRWLALNTGYAALARATAAPFFVYAHGIDFTRPMFAIEPWPVRAAVRALRPLPRLGATATAWRRERRLAGMADGLAAARGVFANSTYTARRLRERFAALTTPVVINPPGVDAIFYATPSPDRSPAAGTLRLLTVSRLDPHSRLKNVDGTLHAVARLAGELDVILEVVGDGGWRPRLEALAAELGIAERVRFAGSLSQRALVAAYDRADLFVLAARATADDFEGFGIVYGEAAARGVPALASRAGGATDAIVDGRTGVVVDAASPAAIAAGVRRFAARRDAFDPTALRAFAERFRWPRVGAALHAALGPPG